MLNKYYPIVVKTLSFRDTNILNQSRPFWTELGKYRPSSHPASVFILLGWIAWKGWSHIYRYIGF